MVVIDWFWEGLSISGTIKKRRSIKKVSEGNVNQTHLARVAR